MHLKSLIFNALLLIVYAFTISAVFPTDVSDFLTQSLWTQMESYKDKEGDGNFVFDTDSCQADNNWLFRPDGTFEMTEDVRKCEPDMPFLDTLSGNWSLKNNQTVLSLDLTEFDLDFQIDAIGPNEVILHIMDTENPNTPAWEKILLRR
ncbi:MAG: hypothetical protein EPGJADBJ_05417 [Saprospiraceae bacterium]|nr:hypothetical protein [Saprospiraceae bacterium]